MLHNNNKEVGSSSGGNGSYSSSSRSSNSSSSSNTWVLYPTETHHIVCKYKRGIPNDINPVYFTQLRVSQYHSQTNKAVSYPISCIIVSTTNFPKLYQLGCKIS